MTKDDNRWEFANEIIAKEVLRQAEEYLRSQLQSGIAADQRAMQLLAAATALASGVVAAAGALASVDRLTLPLLFAIIVWILSLSFAVGCAAFAARPTQFYHPGNIPSNWDEVDFKKRTSVAIGEAADGYGRCIGKNAEILQANGRWHLRATIIFGSSPVLAGFIFLVVLACSAGWAEAVAQADGKAVGAIAAIQEQKHQDPCVRAEGPLALPQFGP